MKTNSLLSLATITASLFLLTACFHSYDEALCSTTNAESLFQLDSQLTFPGDNANPAIPVQIEQNLQSKQYKLTMLQGIEKLPVPMTFCLIRGQMYAELEQKNQTHSLMKVEVAPWFNIKVGSQTVQQRQIVLRQIFFSESLVQALEMDYIKTSKSGIVQLKISNASQPKKSILDAINIDANGGVYDLIETRPLK